MEQERSGNTSLSLLIATVFVDDTIFISGFVLFGRDGMFCCIGRITAIVSCKLYCKLPLNPPHPISLFLSLSHTHISVLPLLFPCV